MMEFTCVCVCDGGGGVVRHASEKRNNKNDTCSKHTHELLLILVAKMGCVTNGVKI